MQGRTEANEEGHHEMSSFIEIRIPPELQNSLFFAEESISIDMDKIKEWTEPSTFTHFFYELVFYQRIDAYKPWMQSKTHISGLFKKWEEIKRECEALFSKRKAKETRKPMKEGIALFLTILFWTHHKPVLLKDWNHAVKELKIKPVNLVERFNFIIQRPSVFHSYIQLSELFLELEKQYEKSKVQKNRLRS